MKQMAISARNAQLRGPTARINAVPIFMPGIGEDYPKPWLFPRYPDQFYGLRHPKNKYDRRMLVYLGKYYDIGREDG